MEAIRKVINQSSHEVTIELPKHYRKKKPEVIVLMGEEDITNANQHDYSKFYGTFN